MTKAAITFNMFCHGQTQPTINHWNTLTFAYHKFLQVMSHISLLLPVYLTVSMVTGTINVYTMYSKHNPTYNGKIMIMNTWISVHPLNCLLISEIKYKFYLLIYSQKSRVCLKWKVVETENWIIRKYLTFPTTEREKIKLAQKKKIEYERGNPKFKKK